MARRGRIEEDGFRHITIAEAFSLVNQKVRVTGVIVDKSPPKATNGTDYHCSLTIVDTSHYSYGLLVNFFAETPDHLPQIETIGDIITVTRVRIKTYNEKTNAVFYKRISAFALYEGKYGQSFAPYHYSPNYRMTREDKQVVADLRNWLDSAELDTVPNKSMLRDIRKGEQLDVVCKILHTCEVNQDELMLFVWDGTDAPACIIQEKLDNELECPLPLQLEGETLSWDILSKFPTVGTVLRVKIKRRKEKLDSSSLIVGRWVFLIHLDVQVHAGLWYGIFSPYARIRYVPDEDCLVIKCQSDFKVRHSSQWDRMPFACFPWPPRITETEKEDVAVVTLMDIINYSQVIAKFKCVVRVVAMLPSDPKNFLSPEGFYRIRLTLEDPSARIHAYLFKEDAELFFDGYPGIDELTRKRNKFLGICNEGAEDGPRNPPWMLCGIKSYFLDRTRERETRHYRLFGTKLL